MLETMYIIMGFGTALAARFEGDKWFWCIIGGIFWPITIGIVLYLRMLDK